MNELPEGLVLLMHYRAIRNGNSRDPIANIDMEDAVKIIQTTKKKKAFDNIIRRYIISKIQQ